MISGVVIELIELASLEDVAGTAVFAAAGVDGSGIASDVGVEPLPAGIPVLYGGSIEPSAPSQQIRVELPVQ